MRAKVFILTAVMAATASCHRTEAPARLNRQVSRTLRRQVEPGRRGSMGR